MLIRKNQLSVFDETRLTDFIKISLDFISLNFPDFYAKAPLDSHESLISSMVLYADRFSIYNALNIQKLLCLRILQGEGWLNNPQVIDALTTNEEEDLRIDAIWLQVNSEIFRKKKL
jgi:hypothetical protein